MPQDDVVLRLIAVGRTSLAEPAPKRARSPVTGPVIAQGGASGVPLSVETEQRFGIRITAVEMQHVRSLRDLLALMRRRLPVRLR